jgi:hypothetical protein
VRNRINGLYALLINILTRQNNNESDSTYEPIHGKREDLYKLDQLMKRIQKHPQFRHFWVERTVSAPLLWPR